MLHKVILHYECRLCKNGEWHKEQTGLEMTLGAKYSDILKQVPLNSIHLYETDESGKDCYHITDLVKITDEGYIDDRG